MEGGGEAIKSKYYSGSNLTFLFRSAKMNTLKQNHVKEVVDENKASPPLNTIFNYKNEI